MTTYIKVINRHTAFKDECYGVRHKTPAFRELVSGRTPTHRSMPKLGYIGLKIRFDSRGHSGPACVQTPFLLLKLIKNYLNLVNNTRLGETSAEPNLPLP